jgi:hypothetical protein
MFYLLGVLCILIFGETLFILFFTVLPGLVVVSVITVAAVYSRWFISVM